MVRKAIPLSFLIMGFSFAHHGVASVGGQRVLRDLGLLWRLQAPLHYQRAVGFSI